MPFLPSHISHSVIAVNSMFGSSTVYQGFMFLHRPVLFVLAQPKASPISTSRGRWPWGPVQRPEWWPSPSRRVTTCNNAGKYNSPLVPFSLFNLNFEPHLKCISFHSKWIEIPPSCQWQALMLAPHPLVDATFSYIWQLPLSMLYAEKNT